MLLSKSLHFVTHPDFGNSIHGARSTDRDGLKDVVSLQVALDEVLYFERQEGNPLIAQANA